MIYNWVVDWKKDGDWSEYAFETYKGAEIFANKLYTHLTETDKQKRELFAILKAPMTEEKTIEYSEADIIKIYIKR